MKVCKCIYPEDHKGRDGSSDIAETVKEDKGNIDHADIMITMIINFIVMVMIVMI